MPSLDRSIRPPSGPARSSLGRSSPGRSSLGRSGLGRSSLGRSSLAVSSLCPDPASRRLLPRSGPASIMRIDDLDLPAPELIADPYPILADLRAQAPMAWHERSGMYLAFGYHAANAVLRDRRGGRLWRGREPGRRLEPVHALPRHVIV